MTLDSLLVQILTQQRNQINLALLDVQVQLAVRDQQIVALNQRIAELQPAPKPAEPKPDVAL